MIMSKVIMFNLQKYCQPIVQVIFLFLGLLLSSLACMQARVGKDLTGGSRIGRKDDNQVLTSQYILWKQNKLMIE